jgi:hypothetical protein
MARTALYPKGYLKSSCTIILFLKHSYILQKNLNRKSGGSIVFHSGGCYYLCVCLGEGPAIFYIFELKNAWYCLESWNLLQVLSSVRLAPSAHWHWLRMHRACPNFFEHCSSWSHPEPISWATVTKIDDFMFQSQVL